MRHAHIPTIGNGPSKGDLRKALEAAVKRNAELEQQNGQLQTLLACVLDGDGMERRGGSVEPGSVAVWVPFGMVRAMSGRTVTSDPDHEAGFVRITIDPITLPDFGGDMQALLGREDN